MLRKLIEWLLYRLRLRRRKQVDLIEVLKELLPAMMAMLTIIHMIKSLGPFPRPPWYVRLWYRLRQYARLTRRLAIGY